MCHRGSQWTDFREIWYWGLLKKICQRTSVLNILQEDLSTFIPLAAQCREFIVALRQQNFQHLLPYWEQYKGKQCFRFHGNNGYANRHIVTLHINYLPCYNPPTGQIPRKKLLRSFALRSVDLSFGARFLKIWMLLERKENFWRKRNFVENKGEIMQYVLKCSKFLRPNM